MRLKNTLTSEITESDMTPMIDMVFQLIAFFMVLVNFSTDEQNQKVTLPQSELAKPAEGKLEFPIVINLDAGGTVYMGANVTTVDAIRPLLTTELAVLRSEGKDAADGNIIIRAHKDSAGGSVQELIAKCQEVGFESFALRVKEEDPS
jgi:biopolymer transport protein ExbD